MTAGQLPEGRYGRRRPGQPGRWARVLGVLLAALAGLVVAVVGYRNLADKPIDSEVLGFALLDPASPEARGSGPRDVPAAAGAVSLRFEVRRKDPGQDAVCVVRARSIDGQETGRREVYVPPSDGPVRLTTVIHTSQPPVTADVYGCSLQVPAYLRPDRGR